MQRKLLHSRTDAAYSLSISLRKLDVLIAERKIKIVRIGRRAFVPDSEIVRIARRGTTN